MSIVILRIAAALYALAAGAYIVFFSRPRHRRAATVGFRCSRRRSSSTRRRSGSAAASTAGRSSSG